MWTLNGIFAYEAHTQGILINIYQQLDSYASEYQLLIESELGAHASSCD